MSRIRDATFLITGGASGIGRLLAARALHLGAARVIIWDMQAAALDGAVHELRAAGHEAEGLVIDITDADRVGEATAELGARGTDVDILVNNAGIIVGGTFAAHAHDDIDRTMAVNAIAPMHITRALLPGMITRGRGHIVNISSAAALVSNPGMSVYCASKWALAGWSDSLRLEHERARTGIRVTTVLPFYIRTGMFEGVRSPVIPLLEPDHAARRILDAVERDRIVLRMPRIIDLVPLLRGILPMRWFDRVAGDWFGIYRSMDTFRGRRP